MTLSVKLVLYILLVAIVSTGFVTVSSFLSIQKRVDDAAHNSIDALVKTVYSMAATSMYVNDEELALEVVQGLEYNEAISCAMIHSDTLNVFTEFTCSGEALVIKELNSPWDDQEVVGTLSVFKNNAYLVALAREQVLYELITMIKLILILSAAILVITYLMITKPIERVSRRLSQVRFEGSVQLLDEGGRSDELGNISRVINLMLVHAKKQIISEQVLARRTAEISNHFKLIFELSNTCLAVTDTNLNLKSFNPQFAELIEHAKGSTPSLDTDEWVSCITEEPDALQELYAGIEEMNKPASMEIEFSYNDGRELVHSFFNLTFVKSNADGRGITVLVFISDTTEQRRKLLETEYEANHDSLTSLYNRLAATRKINDMLRSVDGENIGIVFLDLDGFKMINDELGHDAGDVLLRVISTRLKHVIRKNDIAARWGGDEFLIALSNVAPQQALAAANKLMVEIVRPVQIRGVEGERCVGASIGIALSSKENQDFSDLLDQADRAMYNVKRSGKNAILVFSE